MSGPGGTINLTNNDDHFPGVIDNNSGNEIINGLDGNDFIDGGASNDTLNGGAGNDFLSGGSGRDSLYGGAGNDRLYDGIGAVANLHGDAGDDEITFSPNLTSGLIDGGADTDELRVTAYEFGAVSFVGMEILSTSNSQIVGTATQFEAFDTIRDIGYYSKGVVRLMLSASGGPTVLDLADELNSDPNTRGAIITGSTDDETVTGGNRSDTINGDGGDDTLYGGGGLDVLSGGLDNDSLFGGGADDILNGEAGDDRLAGGNSNDMLNGGSGVDRLMGGGGNDTLIGGLDRDILFGGLDNDVFKYLVIGDSGPTGATRDIIKDFETGDRIDLSALDAISGGSHNAFSFIGNAAFTAAGQLRWATTAGGHTLIQANTGGTLAADFSILLQGEHTLSVDDFLL